MADIRTTSQEVQSEILDTVRKSQEAVVDAIKRWADTVEGGPIACGHFLPEEAPDEVAAALEKFFDPRRPANR